MSTASPRDPAAKIEALYLACVRVEAYADRCRRAGRTGIAAHDRYHVHPDLAGQAATVARLRLAQAVHALGQAVDVGGYTLTPEPGGTLAIVPSDRLTQGVA